MPTSDSLLEYHGSQFAFRTAGKLQTTLKRHLREMHS